MDATKCYETLFKGKSKAVDMYRVGFEDWLKIKLSQTFCRRLFAAQLFIPGHNDRFSRNGSHFRQKTAETGKNCIFFSVKEDLLTNFEA